ncbi:hypothetical protein BATDEDRAFT_22221 [Batrachochytrium dendrobatidis JAM81]|uniref:RGS domain-containing protein n=2 Tax=Batrachochytrium dendrobatidis TaxID=109871 RepID=F4NT80_BATDJ|nr:uncharacterized protein BATDEDRAFT_22221 [Batrachochytrium dendrobatidis JAM81]EGF83488.1 hypothetical protein BATDEDRAFT_22221 [Batrachochytrium dendrobatidis JAM81]|eukprot:XP_006675504.1 hypothetical protein BATDEDRAFT_22221 [Batrachochytrium dendrobatidis JAM81]
MFALPSLGWTSTSKVAKGASRFDSKVDVGNPNPAVAFDETKNQPTRQPKKTNDMDLALRHAMTTSQISKKVLASMSALSTAAKSESSSLRNEYTECSSLMSGSMHSTPISLALLSYRTQRPKFMTFSNADISVLAQAASEALAQQFTLDPIDVSPSSSYVHMATRFSAASSSNESIPFTTMTNLTSSPSSQSSESVAAVGKDSLYKYPITSDEVNTYTHGAASIACAASHQMQSSAAPGTESLSKMQCMSQLFPSHPSDTTLLALPVQSEPDDAEPIIPPLPSLPSFFPAMSFPSPSEPRKRPSKLRSFFKTRSNSIKSSNLDSTVAQSNTPNLFQPATSNIGSSTSSGSVSTITSRHSTSTCSNITLSQSIKRSLRTAAAIAWEETHMTASRLLRDPTDVSIKSISREGLSVMLLSCLPLCYFITHLLQEQSIENLFFLLDVELFRHHSYATPEECSQAAQDMYAIYFAPNASFELNVSHKIRKKVLHVIQSGSIECYRDAFDHVAGLLNDAFSRFCQSPRWKLMCNNLGQQTVLHDATTVEDALSHIKTYLPQTISADKDRVLHVLTTLARLDILLDERLTRFLYCEDFEETV